MKVKLDFSPVAQNQIIFTPYTLSKLSTQQQNKCHSPALLTSKWVIGQQLPCRTLFKSSSIKMNKLVCKWIYKKQKTRESEVKFKGLICLIMNTSRKWKDLYRQINTVGQQRNPYQLVFHRRRKAQVAELVNVENRSTMMVKLACLKVVWNTTLSSPKPQVSDTSEGKGCWWGNQTTYTRAYTIPSSNEIIKSCYQENGLHLLEQYPLASGKGN